MAGNAPLPAKLLALVQQRAKGLLKDPQALIQLAKKAEGKAAGQASGPLAGVADELKALLRLLRAYAKGDYRKVSWESMAVVVGAMLYVVSPIDLIPDFLLGSGFLDDASVLAFAYRKVHQEVEEFLEWERANTAGPPPLEPG
ncbi:MAG: YkvA family protein [Acidimicrobiia bacterium]